jgi:hypothetical protein
MKKQPCPCGKPSVAGRALCKECLSEKRKLRYATDPQYRAKLLQSSKDRYKPPLEGGKGGKEYAKNKYHHYRRMAFKTLGGYICAICGLDDPRALQIDHIADDGYQKRQVGELGVRLYRQIIRTGGTGFQVLCASCNWIKKAESEGRTLEYYWEEQDAEEQNAGFQFRTKKKSKVDPEVACANFLTSASAGSIATRLHMSSVTLRELWLSKFGEEAVRERGRKIQAEAVRLTGLANKKKI